MGNQNWFGVLKELLLNNINDIEEDSIVYEEVNYEAFNVYFQNAKKLYSLQVELNSGIHIHLQYHHGYLKNGDKSFITDPIMNNNTFKEIRKIKNKTLFNYNLRMKKLILLFCEQINGGKAFLE